MVFIGHAGHPEVEGTLGQIDGEVHLVENEEDVEKLPIPPETPIAYITQTTLSVDDTRGVIAALHRRFIDVAGPEIRDICYATQNRQSAVRELSRVADVLIVVGARNSSNSNRLQEIGEEAGLPELSRSRQRRDRCGMGAQCRRCRSNGRRFGARDRRRGRGSDLDADQAVGSVDSRRAELRP